MLPSECGRSVGLKHSRIHRSAGVSVRARGFFVQDELVMDVQGMAIGNGWIDPISQVRGSVLERQLT